MSAEGQHIVNFTFVFHWHGINMMYSPENLKLLNGKQVLFVSKQLQDNTWKGKLIWCTSCIKRLDKLECCFLLE